MLENKKNNQMQRPRQPMHGRNYASPACMELPDNVSIPTAHCMCLVFFNSQLEKNIKYPLPHKLMLANK